MSIAKVRLFETKTVPVLLQSEATECGIACLAMIASYYGHLIDLTAIRERHSISLKGTTLSHLIKIADELKLVSRPLRAEMDSLADVKLPCIVHLDFNHFAVLTGVRKQDVALIDPSSGKRVLSKEEFSKHFTGVVLELSPGIDFESKNEIKRVKLRELLGSLPGIGGTVTQLIVLALALQVFTLISPLFVQLVVDNALVSEDSDLLTVLGLGFLLLGLVQVSTSALRSLVALLFSTAVGLQLTTNLFRHLIRLPIGFIAKRHLGDVVSRFSSVDTIQRTLTTGSIEVVLDGILAVATLGLMFFYSSILSVVALTATGMYAALRIYRYRIYRQFTNEQIVRAAKLNSNFLETIRGIQSIKIFNRELQRRSMWHNLFVDNVNAGIRVQRLGITFQVANGLVSTIENIASIWLAALLVLGGTFSIGMLFAYIAFKSQFMSRVSSVIDKAIDFSMLTLHLERVSDIVLSPVEENPVSSLGEERPYRAELVASDATFKYSESDPPVFSNLSISIKEGEFVAIVGPSGCGKTTLLRVLIGLFPLSNGKILLDGVDIQRIGPANYRSMLGVVMQDDQLFAGSLSENICFFDQHPDLNKIQDCARLAAIHDDILSMPMGYHTLVGDMGAALSGGQKQRILLARALYNDPRILFLDEATSHLDVETERVVTHAIQHLKLTRVVVAHRPDTIAMADRVIRLEGGRVTQDFRQVSNQPRM